MNIEGNSFLFTGDAMENAERDMLANGLDLSADVLKVGHHGPLQDTDKQYAYEKTPAHATCYFPIVDDG